METAELKSSVTEIKNLANGFNWKLDSWIEKVVQIKIFRIQQREKDGKQRREGKKTLQNHWEGLHVIIASGDGREGMY